MLSGTMEICDFFIKLVISLPLIVGQSIDTDTGDLKPHFEATFISTYTTPRRSISHGNEKTKLERPYQVTQTASAVKYPSTSQPTILSNINISFAFPSPLFQNGLMSKPDYFPTEMKPPLMLEQIPLATYQTVNFSNIFQSASLGRQPGLMVEGPGTDFMRPYPVNNFTHVYEDLLPKPVYIDYPGMIGGDEQVKLQTQANGLSSLYGRLSSNTDVHVPKQDLSLYENVKPIYYYSTHDAFDMSNQSNENKTNENKTELFDGHQSSLNEAMQTFQPIMSGYQWHGEWPGNTESEKNQDWSRGWVDSGSNKEDEEKSNTGHQMTRISVNNADKGVDFGFMTATINAGSPKVDQAIQSNKDKIDNMQQTLDTFQKFLSFLRNAGTPLGQERGNKEDSTYNELAKGWAKDVHA